MATYIAGSAASNQVDGTSASIAVTLGAAVAVGDVIVGMIGNDATGSPVVTVDDNLGGGTPNVYTLNSDLIHDAPHNQDGQTFRCKVTQAGTPVITGHFAPSASSERIIVAAYSGSAAAPFDTSLGNNQLTPGTGTDAVTSTNITTATNNEMLVGFYQNIAEAQPGTGTITAGTNYTLRHSPNAILAVEDRILVTAGLVAATFTISIDHSTIAHIVAIKDAGGAPTRTLLGVGT